MASCIIVGLVWLLPESPRWLYVNNKQESAKAMLIKYHGEGSESNAWVQLQLSEYEQYLEMDGADKRWWDYRALFRNRASIYRLACNCVISIYGQWAGNGKTPLLYSCRSMLTQLSFLQLFYPTSSVPFLTLLVSPTPSRSSTSTWD